VPPIQRQGNAHRHKMDFRLMEVTRERKRNRKGAEAGQRCGRLL